MKPFFRAQLVPPTDEEIQQQVTHILAMGPEIYEQACGPNPTKEALVAWLRKISQEEAVGEVWRNANYQVRLRRLPADKESGWPAMIHLSIKRTDRQIIHDWRVLQEIKNALVGPEHEAVELYPAESRRVDGANQYHLWALADPQKRFPFGYTERAVCDMPYGKAKQRKL